MVEKSTQMILIISDQVRKMRPSGISNCLVIYAKLLSQIIIMDNCNSAFLQFLFNLLASSLIQGDVFFFNIPGAMASMVALNLLSTKSSQEGDRIGDRVLFIHSI